MNKAIGIISIVFCLGGVAAFASGHQDGIEPANAFNSLDRALRAARATPSSEITFQGVISCKSGYPRAEVRFVTEQPNKRVMIIGWAKGSPGRNPKYLGAILRVNDEEKACDARREVVDAQSPSKIGYPHNQFCEETFPEPGEQVASIETDSDNFGVPNYEICVIR